MRDRMQPTYAVHLRGCRRSGGRHGRLGSGGRPGLAAATVGLVGCCLAAAALAAVPRRPWVFGPLSARLEAVAELVPRGRVLADVGSCSGQLAAHLLARGVVPSAIATDKSPAAIRDGRARVAAWLHSEERPGTQDALRSLDFRVGDGLAPLGVGEAETVVLVGMGGGLICDILSAPGAPGALERVSRLVLGPQSKSAEVRAFLAAHGWRPVAERVVVERALWGGRGKRQCPEGSHHTYEIVACERCEGGASPTDIRSFHAPPPLDLLLPARVRSSFVRSRLEYHNLAPGAAGLGCEDGSSCKAGEPFWILRNFMDQGHLSHLSHALAREAPSHTIEQLLLADAFTTTGESCWADIVAAEGAAAAVAQSYAVAGHVEAPVRVEPGSVRTLRNRARELTSVPFNVAVVAALGAPKMFRPAATGSHGRAHAPVPTAAQVEEVIGIATHGHKVLVDFLPVQHEHASALSMELPHNSLLVLGPGLHSRWQLRFHVAQNDTACSNETPVASGVGIANEPPIVTVLRVFPVGHGHPLPPVW